MFEDRKIAHCLDQVGGRKTLPARLKCTSCAQENIIPNDRILPGRTGTRAEYSFLSGGGELGALIRSFDWAATPLGEPGAWPQSLRSALSICLHSSFPTAIYWGEDLRLLYNDAWAPIPAERHPAALGQPGAHVWSDIWSIVGPQFRCVVETEQFGGFGGKRTRGVCHAASLAGLRATRKGFSHLRRNQRNPGAESAKASVR